MDIGHKDIFVHFAIFFVHIYVKKYSDYIFHTIQSFRYAAFFGLVKVLPHI